MTAGTVVDGHRALPLQGIEGRDWGLRCCQQASAVNYSIMLIIPRQSVSAEAGVKLWRSSDISRNFWWAGEKKSAMPFEFVSEGKIDK